MKPHDPSGPPRLSRQVVVGLTVAILLDTGLQILWKVAVEELPDQPSLWQTATAMLHQPLFLLVGLLMFGQACNWLVVLDHTDLSYAHAITSLSYVTVAALSVFSLGETISPAQAVGIALILVGVWFVGKSGQTPAAIPHETAP